MTTDRMGSLARDYWPMLAGVIAAAIAWGTLTAQISSITDGQSKIAAKIDQLSTGLASTQATVQWTGQDLTSLQARVNALEIRR